MSATPPATNTPAQSGVPGGGKIRLAVAAALLVAWLGWLSYTALTKSREPTVSRAQAAATGVPVVAKLQAGGPEREPKLARSVGIAGPAVTPLKEQAEKPSYIVKVVEPLQPGGPPKDSEIGVTNLPGAAGYTGPGEYLLLLVRQEDATIDGRAAYLVVGQQRSPGADLDNVGPPMIYRWGPEVQAQVKRLFPTKD